MNAFEIFITIVAVLLLIVILTLNFNVPITKDDVDIKSLDLKRCEYLRLSEFFSLNNPEYLGKIDVYLIYLHNGKLYKRLD